MEKITSAIVALNSTLKNFMGNIQRLCLLDALNGEEAEGIADVILRVEGIVKNTPKTYETDGQGDKAVVHLHYFRGRVDAWITERDVGDSRDGDGLGPQHQAFGKMSLFGSKCKDAEFGYVSISQLLQYGVELDLYWEPKPLSEC